MTKPINLKIPLRVLYSFLFLFLLSARFLASPAGAEREFSVRQELFYEIEAGGDARVSQSVELTNLFSKVYAKHYTFNLEALTVTDVAASDEVGGGLETIVSHEGNRTIITVLFAEPIVGRGKLNKFTVNYRLKNLAKRSGQIWEIAIPKMSDSASFEELSLAFSTPDSWGRLAYISPLPQDQERRGAGYLFRYSKDQLAGATISAAFGDLQIFDFALEYHLENQEMNKGFAEIALPPDTFFQQVVYNAITPQPLNVEIDRDGNWLARYELKGKQQLDVSVLGHVRIFSSRRTDFSPEPQDLSAYLKATSYWPTQDAQIQALVNNLDGVEEIYRFVIKTLDYNYHRVDDERQRLGASQALKEPQNSICTEFTDLFITFCRAKGIPAREINGHAYTNNPELRLLNTIADVLHSWPEYWDEKAGHWVPVDPTWQKTTGGLDYFHKFDLNHFVFAVHGLSDSSPLPAGAYRSDGRSGKDVQVIFGTPDIEPEARFEVELSVNSDLLKSQESGQLIIKNTGTTALYNLPVKISAQNIELSSKGDEAITALPPFARATIPFKIKSKPFAFGRGLILAKVGGTISKKAIKTNPSPFLLLIPVPPLAFLTILIVKRKIGSGGSG